MFRYLRKLFAHQGQPSHRSAPTHTGKRARLALDELAQRVLPSANPIAAHSFAAAGAVAARQAPPANAALRGQEAREEAGHGCDHGAALAARLTNTAGATGQALFNNVN